MDVWTQLSSLLTAALGGSATAAAFGAAAVGAFLWLVGGRFSHSIFALIGVGAGTWLGMHLPARMGWPVDGIAMAFAGALLGGLAGYLLQTTWTGAVLSVLLAAAGGLAAWVFYDGGWTWRPPAWDGTGGQVALLNTIWRSMPGPSLPRVMPYAIAGGLITGGGLVLGWPRLARALTFTLVGLILLIVGALTALQMSGTAAGALVPSTVAGRFSVFAAFTVLGLAVQWWTTPAARVASSEESTENEETASERVQSGSAADLGRRVPAPPPASAPPVQPRPLVAARVAGVPVASAGRMGPGVGVANP